MALTTINIDVAFNREYYGSSNQLFYFQNHLMNILYCLYVTDNLLDLIFNFQYKVTAWNLEKYAHLNNDNWKLVDRKTGPIMLILQGSLLLVVQNDIALESVALIHTNCRGLARGSTILFLVANEKSPQLAHQGCDSPIQDRKKVSKFRVKFLPEKGRAAEEQMTSCMTALQGFMPIYDTERGVNRSSTHITSLKEIVRNLLDKSEQNKLPAWNAINISEEEEQCLEMTVKLCLLDPSFPILVQKIEEKLHATSLCQKLNNSCDELSMKRK